MTVSDIFLFLSLIFCLIAVMSASGLIEIPIQKIGIPLFWKNVKWTWFIYMNINKSKILDKEHLIYGDKIIVFYYSWLFEVYQGKTIDEIRSKCALGGQSNKADYLTWWEKKMGKKIEERYKVLTQSNK